MSLCIHDTIFQPKLGSGDRHEETPTVHTDLLQFMWALSVRGAQEVVEGKVENMKASCQWSGPSDPPLSLTKPILKEL